MLETAINITIDNFIPYLGKPSDFAWFLQEMEDSYVAAACLRREASRLADAAGEIPPTRLRQAVLNYMRNHPDARLPEGFPPLRINDISLNSPLKISLTGAAFALAAIVVVFCPPDVSMKHVRISVHTGKVEANIDATDIKLQSRSILEVLNEIRTGRNSGPSFDFDSSSTPGPGR